MKRSKMVKKMATAFDMEKFIGRLSTVQIMDKLLYMLETEGMLPPSYYRQPEQFDLYPIKLNAWEKE